MKRCLLLFVILFFKLCAVAEVQPTPQEEKPILSFPYYEATISDLQNKIRSGEETCESITNAFINRILRYDMAVSRRVPFNSIQNINQQALIHARNLDTFYKQHKVFKGSLHCIPVVIKDNISQTEFPVTAGSFAMLGNQPNFTSPAIQSIQRAGGIILASTTMDEFSDGVTGISSRHGRTANAYEVEQSPGGSSGGSAVAVSLNFALLGLGTDLNGSARIPAGFNGIYSIRPTAGLFNNKGVLSQNPLEDLISPMARNPKDLAIFLQVLSKQKNISYSNYLRGGSLQGKRVGVLQSVNDIDLYQGLSEKTLKKHQSFIKRIKGLGAHIILKVQLNGIQLDPELHTVDVLALNQSLQKYPSVRQNFLDICESGRTKHFQGDCKNWLKQTSLKETEQIERIQNNQAILVNFMKEKQLDVLLLPLDSDDHHAAQVQLVSKLGVPALSVLTGYEQDGVPLAMQFIGKPYDERNLLAIAYDYDLHFTPRSVPTMYGIPSRTFISSQQFNFFKDALGQYTYEKFLSEHAYSDLTAVQFANLYTHFNTAYK